MAISEDLLHYIWKFRLFQTEKLYTVKGDLISVLNVGEHNENAGPDFSHAKLRIALEEWNGSVEIHVRSSDWYSHGHQHDIAYENVVLHVVWTHDQAIFYQDKSLIPTLQFSDFVSSDLLWRYQQLMENQRWIPCELQIAQLDVFKTSRWLDRMLVERLEEKSLAILELLSKYQGDWEKVFLIWVCRSFGFKVNSAAFERLGEQLSWTLLNKYRFEELKIEALLFGQSSFLNKEFTEEYPQKLQKEYKYLEQLHGLQTMQIPWKFLRMRPFNFPTIRIAQLAKLIQRKEFRMSWFMDLSELRDFRTILRSLKLASYWETHFSFHNVAKVKHHAHLSKSTQDILIINILIVFQFAYGFYFQQEDRMEKSLRWLEELPKEGNMVIRQFEAIGMVAHHAADSQALLHMKHHYCDHKQCLRCAIGLQILKKD